MKRAKTQEEKYRQMTEMPVSKLIPGLAVPTIISMLISSVYNMADTFFVSQLGTSASGAVGVIFSAMAIIQAIGFGFGQGAGIFISQSLGNRNTEKAGEAAAASFFAVMIIGVFIGVVGNIFLNPLVMLLGATPTIAPYAEDYAMYILIASPFMMSSFVMNNILRAQGNAVYAMVGITVGGVLNMVLDPLFIFTFGMGTAGAAYATVISQGISGLLCLLYIVKAVPIFRLSRRDMVMDGKMMAEQLKVGLPMALQFSITAIGSIMVQTSLNMLGSTLVAAYTAAGKIEQILTQAYVALGTAMANYSAQNVGAGDIPRIRQGFRAATIWGSVYSVAAGVLIMTVGKYLTYLFVSEDAAMLLDSVDLYLKCIGFFFIPLNIVNAYRNGLQGLGYGLLPMTAGVAELAGRGVIAVISARYSSYFGICMAGPAAWVLAGGLLVVLYFYIVKKDLPRTLAKRKEHGMQFLEER